MPVIKRVQKNNVSDQVYEQLKDNIVRRVFAPGSKLPSENDLANSFGVSRISVRAAIQKLSAIGLLESRSGEGTFVKKADASIYMNSFIPMLILEPKGIIELLEFRKGLEMQSCELAASRATAEEIAELNRIMEKMNQSFIKGDIEQYSVEDFNFHFCIAQMAKNSVIESVLLMLKEPIFKHLEEMNQQLGLALGNYGHKNIFEAIKNKDPKAASYFMERAVESSIEKMRLLEKNVHSSQRE